MRRFARITGTVMIVFGVCAVAWVVLVWQWQDPFTALYTKYEQHKLASRFAHRFADYKPPASIGPVTKKPDGSVSVDAARARIEIPLEGPIAVDRSHRRQMRNCRQASLRRRHSDHRQRSITRTAEYADTLQIGDV